VSATLDPALFLSTHAYEQDIPPSIADGVAGLLSEERTIVVVTGRPDGRMSGFLADLCHGISKRNTLLRVKAPLPPEEFQAALAAQLQLPLKPGLPVAAQVGRRLDKPAPRGRFVLVCEGADQYSDETLEAVREVSNHPVSIVLAGSPRLSRRLARRQTAALGSRVTHLLALNRPAPWANPFWWIVVPLVAAGVALLWWAAPLAPPSMPREEPPVVGRIATVPRPAPPLPPAPAPVAEPAQEGLTLVWERELASAPRTP
jgi:hypothetical protein